MLDEKWTYWESPQLGAELPIKWEIVQDPVDEGTAVDSNDSAAEGGLYGAADIVTKKKYKDVRLHVEFLKKLTEVQILPSTQGMVKSLLPLFSIRF